MFEEAPHLRAAMWDVIRRPVSYAGYEYYSQAPRGFVDADGETWLVRFRLRPSQEHADQGHYDPGSLRYPPDPPELLPRDPSDGRSPSFLHDELRAAVVDDGVTGVLQLQLHRLTDSRVANDKALDPSLAWSAEDCPWHDVARLELGELVDDNLIEGLAFSTGNAPASLGIALAQSPDETASVNHLRVLMYKLAWHARRGGPLPPEPAALTRPVARVSTRRTVCVIGGGPTGLTVARELERAGHRAVVLEQRADVGGKCDSAEIGGHAFHLRGHLCTTQYENVAALATELGMSTEDTTPHRVYDAEAGTSAPQSSSFFRRETVQRYLALRAEKFPRIAEPGLAHSAKALATPVAEWLAEHDLDPFAASFGVGYTAAGYGFLEGDLPALYFVKYVEMTGLLSNKPALLGHAGSFTISGGFLGLWQRVAAELSDVRCGAEITSIERTPDGVVVHANGERIEADQLVLTVPMGQLEDALDLTEEEKDIACRVRTVDYRTTLATASGLPRSAFYLVRQHCEPGAPDGHCVSFHHRYPESDVYAAYSYGEIGGLAEDFARFGGQLDEVHLDRQWTFMPHFGSEDLRAGIFDRIERLQGVRGTFHAGSLPAFELVECNVAYAKELVRRHFPAPNGSVPAEPVVDTPAVEPAKAVSASEIEAWLVEHIAIEARLPVVDPDSPLDSFMLNSLSVAALQAELSDWLGFRIPHTLFLEVSTITAMARHLARLSEPGESPEPVTPSRVLRLTPVRPFFCVPGAVGAPQYLLPLARAVGTAQAFYGLTAPGVGGDREPLEDVAELAAYHLREVRRTQPHGPYLLGGHSFGGIVAHEMGRQLRAEGERVHVVLLDCYLPEPGQPVPPANPQASIEELLAMHRCLHGVADDPEFALHPGMPLAEQYERLGRALGATGAAPIEEYVAGLLSVYEGNLAATVAHRPARTDFPVTLIKAGDGFPKLRGGAQVKLRLGHPRNGWTADIVPDLRVVTVRGDHFTMLTPPYVSGLADVLRSTLDGRGSKRRRWVAPVLSAAAAALVVAMGGVALTDSSVPQPPSGTRTLALGASMSVDVIPAKGWIRWSGHFGGIATGTRCHLVVVSRTGERIPAGGWVAGPASATVDGTALIAAEDVAGVDLDAGGGVLSAR